MKVMKEMVKGLDDKDLDQIEAAHRIIKLAQEKQKKAKEEMESIHMEKRQLTDKPVEKITKKLKTQWKKESWELFLKMVK